MAQFEKHQRFISPRRVSALDKDTVAIKTDIRYPPLDDINAPGAHTREPQAKSGASFLEQMGSIANRQVQGPPNSEPLPKYLDYVPPPLIHNIYW